MRKALGALCLAVILVGTYSIHKTSERLKGRQAMADWNAPTEPFRFNTCEEIQKEIGGGECIDGVLHLPAAATYSFSQPEVFRPCKKALAEAVARAPKDAKLIMSQEPCVGDPWK